VRQKPNLRVRVVRVFLICGHVQNVIFLSGERAEVCLFHEGEELTCCAECIPPTAVATG
jgi:hypothetical protein